MLFELIKEDEKRIAPIRTSSLADAGWMEKDLENVLAQNITSLIDDEHLMVISQERPRQAEPDIIAIDKDGVLHIFELKRTKSDPENLLSPKIWSKIWHI